MLKKLFLIIAIPLVLILAAYLLAVYQNKRELAYPQTTQIRQQLEQSIQWLLNHETEVLSQNNVMLWWMLEEAQKKRPDKRLAGLLDKYLKRYHNDIRRSYWEPLFGGPARNYIGAYSVAGLPYYNQYFIYALHCAGTIADELPLVAQQNDAAFCHQVEYIYRPACITHQLMGINFLFTRQCNLLPEIDEVMRSLQQDIVFQLSWDIRVVDVYLQRVMMLLTTGAEDSVKPVWIQQVLDHQLKDGGWGDFDPLISLGNGKSLGFSSRILSIGKEKSTFHATAQGVFILSYLLMEH